MKNQNNFPNCTFYISALVFALLSLGCPADPCDAPETANTLLLSDEGKTYFQPYEGAQSVVFKTIGSQDELTVPLIALLDTMVSYSVDVVCEEGATQVQNAIGTSEVRQVALRSPEFQRDLVIRLVRYPEGAEDLLVVYDNGERLRFGAGVIGLLAHQTGTASEFSVLRDSVVLANRTFYEVIEPNLSNPGFESFDPPLEIKYTSTEGIIYINDLESGRQWVLDRIE